MNMLLDNIRAFVSGLKIRTQLWLIPITLAGAILITFILSFFYTNENAVVQYYYEIAVRQYEYIDYWIERRIENIEKTAGAGDVTAALRGGRSERFGNDSAPARALKSAMRDQNVYARMTLLGRGGTVLYNSDGYENAGAAAFYPKVAGTNDIVIGDAYIDTSGDRARNCVPVSYPVYENAGETGEITGYLVAHINLDMLKDSISRINLGSKGAAYIIDKRGSVICSSGDSEFKKNSTAFGDYYISSGEARSQGYRLISPDTGRLTPGAARCLDTRHSGYQVYSNDAGVQVLGIWKWMSYMEWVFLIEVGKNYAFMPMYRTLAVNFLFALVFTGLALGIAAFFSAGINKSLGSFFQFFSRGAGGDLTVRYPLETVSCSSVVKCGNTECPEYGEENSLCFFETGSMAVLFGKEATCRKIVDGTYAACKDCPVYRMRTSNEIALMACYFNVFMDRMQSVISRVKTVNDQLSGYSRDMSEASNEFSRSIQEEAAIVEEVSATVEEISANSDQISDSARGQNVSLGSLSERIGELAGIISEVHRRMDDFLSNYGAMSEKAVRGEESLKGMNSGLLRIVDGSKRISDSIKIVEEISEQINLLSLNASIEAARVGEAGKGFAVVAAEVSKLADKTAQSVKEIEGLVGRNFAEIDRSLSTMTGTIQLISGVFEGLNSINSMIGAIGEKIESQSKANEVVRSETASVQEKSNLITGATSEQKNALAEISKAMGDINITSQTNSTVAEEIAVKSGEVAKAAQLLKDETEFFKV